MTGYPWAQAYLSAILMACCEQAGCVTFAMSAAQQHRDTQKFGLCRIRQLTYDHAKHSATSNNQTRVPISSATLYHMCSLPKVLNMFDQLDAKAS